MKMMKIKETMKKMKKKAKMVATMASLAVTFYMTNPVTAHAAVSGTLTMSGLENKINVFIGAIMAIEAAIACGVFGAFSGKDLIIYLTGGDEQEKKAALKNVKSKVPVLVAILLGAELITLIAGYFVKNATMPTVTM